MKYWEIEIDGSDRTGKDTLCYYICKMSNWKFSINVRGLISQLVYNRKFKRDYKMDLTNFNKDKILIVLYADEEDLKIRCSNTKEEPYDIVNDTKMFVEIADELTYEGYEILTFNTSKCTPYFIAKKVIEHINILERMKNNG